MKRRDFSKGVLALGLAAPATLATSADLEASETTDKLYTEPSRKLPIRKADVVVAGAGTGGVVAALAAAKQGAKTVLIERKGYPGGTITEGGTALHSFFNLWKAFPGVEKRQVVRGMPQQIIDRLATVGATSGHCEMDMGYNYDSVCTSIDTELYKLVTFEMLVEAGVHVCVNTLLTGAIAQDGHIQGMITESRSGREAIMADAFVDCTAYGDLAAFAGADFTEPNDYAVCGSMGVGNVDLEKLEAFLVENDALTQRAKGQRYGLDDQIVRLQGNPARLPKQFHEGARSIGMSMVTTTVYDNYFMFIKLNLKMREPATNRDAVARAELDLRQRQYKGLELFRKFVPGCEKAFIARTTPSLNIRRARLIDCDYDVSHDDVIEGRHFDDDICAYGFHDMAPRLQIKEGRTYGIPYRALLPKGIDNLLLAGMMITSDRRAHMSTRNTVSCMAQGQAVGTAAALCSAKKCATRVLPYSDLRETLERDGVYFEG